MQKHDLIMGMIKNQSTLDIINKALRKKKMKPISRKEYEDIIESQNLVEIQYEQKFNTLNYENKTISIKTKCRKSEIVDELLRIKVNLVDVAFDLLHKLDKINEKLRVMKERLQADPTLRTSENIEHLQTLEIARRDILRNMENNQITNAIDVIKRTSLIR